METDLVYADVKKLMYIIINLSDSQKINNQKITIWQACGNILHTNVWRFFIITINYHKTPAISRMTNGLSLWNVLAIVTFV